MAYDRSLRLAVTDFDAAVTAVRQALADQGFGILAEIDVKATLRAGSVTAWRAYLRGRSLPSFHPVMRIWSGDVGSRQEMVAPPVRRRAMRSVMAR